MDEIYADKKYNSTATTVKIYYVVVKNINYRNKSLKKNYKDNKCFEKNLTAIISSSRIY